MNPVLRLLEPSDADAFQSLRLEGLVRQPTSFRATCEEEAAQSQGDLARRLTEQAVFGAFIDGELCGIAGFAQASQAKKRHKGELWGVYVRPGARREGLGGALVGSVIEHARRQVAQLHATVAMTNQPARRLYRRLGFEPYGLEPRGLKVGGGYLDQELLLLLLDAAASGARARRVPTRGREPGNDRASFYRPSDSSGGTLRPAPAFSIDDHLPITGRGLTLRMHGLKMYGSRGINWQRGSPLASRAPRA